MGNITWYKSLGDPKFLFECWKVVHSFAHFHTRLGGICWYQWFLFDLGIKNVVIVGVFSPVSGKQEDQVGAIIKSVCPAMSMTLSHEVGLIGLLERENAAVLNESLKPLCHRTVKAFCGALSELGLKCPLYMTQNDGTIIRYNTKLGFLFISSWNEICIRPQEKFVHRCTFLPINLNVQPYLISLPCCWVCQRAWFTTISISSAFWALFVR